MTTTAPSPMTPARCRRIALVGAFGVLLSSIYAQTAAPIAAQLARYDTNRNGVLDPDERAAMQAADGNRSETIMLTPFEVSTDQDKGYAAGNTLSGGRVDMPLAITPASISVMTKEFLEDFDITDMSQAAAWTIGMEAAEGGESGPFGGNRFQANFRGGGGGANFPMRDGSLQYFVADSYNSERFEFSRGPNTALFGDGGPGGIQGSSSKQARLNNFQNSASFRVDSFGGYRATLDSNYGRQRLAMRVNLLHQNIKSYQDGTSNKQNAITVAATYKLAENTQFRAQFERSAEYNILYRKTYGEQASLWNRTTVNNNNTTLSNPNSVGLEVIANATTDYLVWNFGTDSLINYKGNNQYRTRGLGYQIPWGGRPDIPNFHPGVDKKFNLGPADSAADRDMNAQAFYLDHRFTPNLFIQLGIVKSDVDPITVYAQNVPNEYRIDVNRLLPNGSPNPKFGKAYAEFSQNIQNQQDRVREYKFIGTYRFSVPRFFDLKQAFNLNGGWRQAQFEARNRAWRWANNPAQPDPSHNNNQFRYRVYWDDPRESLGPVTPPAAPGFNFRLIDTGGNINQRTITYGQIFSQTAFFNERLAITGSFRRDKVEGDFFTRVGVDANYGNVLGFAGVPGAHGLRKVYQNGEALGLVAYPFPARFRFLRPLGLVANYSSNFQQVSSNLNPLITGEPPPLTYAKTKDVGLRYSVPNGIAYATLTYYNTDQHNNLSGFGNASDFRDIWTNLGYTDPALTTSAGFAYQDTNDRKLEGWEFELTANPTPNLTFTANYSKPIVKTVSDSPGRRAYYAQHRAEFAAGAAAQPDDIINGRAILDPGVIQDAMQDIENSFNGSTAGTLANGLERHRINVAGSYRFREGALRGFGVNAGVNYRGHRKNGSRDAQIKFGTTSPTIAQNVAAAYDYLWTPPTWQVSAGANYTRRFGKYTTRFQLNVTNLLNDDDPQWRSYSTINANQLLNGNPRMQVLSGFNQLDPRKFTFTTTVSF